MVSLLETRAGCFALAGIECPLRTLDYSIPDGPDLQPVYPRQLTIETTVFRAPSADDLPCRV
jgi:hypothetical protein